MTPHDLFIKAGRAAVYAYFNAIAQGYYSPTAITKAVREFDAIWLANQMLVTFDKRLGNYDGRLLVERLASVYNPKEDEVVAVNYPIELALTSNLILTDQIDVLIINKKSGRGGKQTIRGVCFQELDSNDNDRYTELRANLFKSAIQCYLGNQTRRHYSYEVRPFQGSDKVIDPKVDHRQHLTRLVTNVMKGIKHQVWYPTSSKETCRQCHLKKTCNFSLLTGQGKRS